jgi:RNA polymerase sigma factor (sigma-70 family)
MAAHLDPASPALGDASDMELVEQTRAGNSAAFGELWIRHSNAGRAVARSHRFDADDLLSEAFARVFQAITAGGGPTAAFRPYLFTTIRNVSMQWARAKSADASEDLDLMADPSTEEDASLAALDKSLTVNAFRSLPTRWQEALWYSEVEQLTSAEIAPLLGMKANAVSALTYRAREGLRQAWIQAHLKRTTDPECAATIERLGSFTRGMLGTRESKRVRDHLSTCTSCTIVADEARKVGSRLALVLLPLAAGVSGAAGFLSWLQAGSGAAGGMAAAAAMPAHVSSSATQVVAPAYLVDPSASSLAAANSAAAPAAASSVSGVVASTGVASTGVAATGIAAGGVIGTVVGAVAVAAAVVVAVALGPTLFAGHDEATTASGVEQQSSAADDTPIPDSAAPAQQTTPSPSPTSSPDPTPSPDPVRPTTPSTPAPAPAPTVPVAPAASEPAAPERPTDPVVVPTIPPVQPTPQPTPPPTTPPAPVLDVVSFMSVQDPDRLTPPIYSGSNAAPGAVVEVLDVDDFVLASTVADDSGSWTIDSFPGITGGERQVRLVQYLPSTPENVSTPSEQQPLVVAAPPALTFEPNAGAAPGQTLATVTGVPSSRVQVFVNGVNFGETLLDASGVQTYSFWPAIPITVTLQYLAPTGTRVGLLSEPVSYAG